MTWIPCLGDVFVGHVQTLCNMAWLKYHWEGDAREAEKLLRTAIQIDHDDPDVLHMVCSDNRSILGELLPHLPIE